MIVRLSQPPSPSAFAARALVACLLMASVLVLTRSPLVAAEIGFVETRSPQPGVVEICWLSDEQQSGGTVTYGTGEQLDQVAAIAEERGRNHRLRLTGLDPEASYCGRIVHADGTSSEVFTFTAQPPVPPATTATDIVLRISEPTAAARRRWPVTVGVPFARGTVAGCEDLHLEDAQGTGIPVQAEAWSRWPDGSLRWAIVRFLADSAAGSEVLLRLRAAPGAGDGGGSVLAARAALRAELAAYLSALRLTAGDGSLLQPTIAAEDLLVEVDGPVATRVAWRGVLGDDPVSEGVWVGVLRATAWVDIPLVSLDYAVYLDGDESVQAAKGQVGTFTDMRSLSVRLPRPAGDLAVGFDEVAPVPLAGDAEVELVQQRDRRWVRRLPGHEASGERSPGLLQVRGAQAHQAIMLQDFWQTYPSAYRVDGEAIEVELLPPLAADEFSAREDQDWHRFLYAWFNQGRYHLRLGQMTRHTLHIHRDARSLAAADLQGWLQQPLIAVVDPEHACATGAWTRPILPQSAAQRFPILATWDQYARMLLADIDHDREDKRSYGWMTWGDWFGERFTHYGNGEYDTALGYGLQYLRTGERVFYDRAVAMARHVASVDVMHHRSSQARDIRQWMHPVNHVGTDLLPEQIAAHPDHMPEVEKKWVRPEIYWTGGVDHGHNYYAGLWLMATLIGDPYVREAAHHLSEGTARHQTASGMWWGYERDIGYPLDGQIAAYRITGDPYYLNAARFLVRAAIERQHPETGGWPGGHRPFAAGILLGSVLRYLEEEPRPRPEVRRMVVEGARWLRDYAWMPKALDFEMMGPAEPEDVERFRAKWDEKAAKGRLLREDSFSNANYLGLEAVAFAYGETQEQGYLDLFHDMVAIFDRYPQTFEATTTTATGQGVGKVHSAKLRQTIHGLSRMAEVAPGFLRELTTGKPIEQRRTPETYAPVPTED